MPTTAREWITHLLDPGWEELFGDVLNGDPLGFPGYPDQLEAARASTGESESVLVARGSLGDGTARAVVISFEFGFLGGSLGVAAGERICRAFEHATAERLPVVALCASGGARMQEGMLALVQMPATLNARAAFAQARRPFVAYLRNPTTGGVFASFANSADLLWAEPGATIGFAGPRVAETITGAPLPDGSHTAESAYAASLLDEIVRPDRLRARLLNLLSEDATAREAAARDAGAPEDPAPSSLEPDELLRAVRDPARPTGSDYLGALLPLRRGGDDPTIVCGVTGIGGRRVVAVAQNRLAGTGRPTPAAYGRARCAIATAERLGLPVVTFVDTPGAEPGAQAESAGIGREIAATCEALLRARVPTVAVVVGEGGSGGALALAACDRVLIQQHAVFSVIAPEGAASILRRDDVGAVAHDLRLTAHDLRRAGLADRVIAEPKPKPEPEQRGGDADRLERARDLTHAAVAWAIADIEQTAGTGVDDARTSRWRALGRTLDR